MTARNPRICADCRHCEQRRTLFILTEEYCANPKAVDLVTGKAVWRARQLRDPGSRLCGASGRLWEAKGLRPVPSEEGPLFYGDAGRHGMFSAATLKTKMDNAQDDATKQYHAYLRTLLPEDALDVVRGDVDPVDVVLPFAKAIKEARK